VDDEGLGIVVTQTTEFDPTRMRSRFIYWLDLAVNEMAKQVRDDINGAGFKVNEAEYEKEIFRNKTISSIPFNEMSGKVRSIVASWSTNVPVPKMASAAKTYGTMAAKLALSYALPWVGIALTISSLFGGKKEMSIPWNSVYAQALPFAQETTVNEEVARILGEKQQIEQTRITAIEKLSKESAAFKLPEGVIAIKHGALVMALKGQPVEVRK
jgi:hypothetical protein